MLSRSHRISGREIEKIIKNGKVIHSPFFTIRFYSNKVEKNVKMTVIVPVKIAKTSVLRHLVRRRMYEAVRPLVEKIKPENLIIIFAKSTVLDQKPAFMNIQMRDIFVKAGLLR